MTKKRTDRQKRIRKYKKNKYREIKKALYETELFSTVVTNTREEVCSVCLHKMVNGQKLSKLNNCGHCFHPTCISMWIVTHNKDTCPTCRTVAVISEPVPRSIHDVDFNVLNVVRFGPEGIDYWV